MARARIRVQPPEGSWKRDVTADFPDHLFRLPSMTMRDRTATEVVAAFGAAVEPCLSALERHPDIEESTVLHRGQNRGILQLQTTNSVLLTASAQAGTPLVYPLELSQGEVIADVISPDESISDLGSQLQRTDAAFEVVYVQRDHEMCRVLTERQREVLLAAVEHGYFETPRRCSLTELADKLGIAKSTCSGMIQRAEDALVREFLGEQPATQHHSRNDQVCQEIEGSTRSSSYL